MTDDKHARKDLTIQEPRDPLEVLVPEPPMAHRPGGDAQSERPQGSFEMAWRLAH